jgi:hypothetical protein
MRLRFTSSFLAAMLAMALASGFAQEQQPGKDQTSPDSNAPQSSSPQSTPQAPPGSDTQSAAPAQSKPEQVAPNPGEAAPPNQSAPATQEQAPPHKEPQPARQATPEANNPAKPKPSTHKTEQRNKRKRKATAQAKSVQRPKTTKPSSSGEPGKVVVRNGGASDDVVHLSPGGSQEQEAHNRENTEQLLATTDGNLKMLASRQLSPAEQSTVDQIHSYMRQAKSAADSGDLARAHTLAFKAHLLSDDLAKR